MTSNAHQTRASESVAQQAREPRKQLGHAEAEDDRQQERDVLELVHRISPLPVSMVAEAARRSQLVR
jgi:hypothetical protein